MVKIATTSHTASLGLLCDIHHIAISVLCLIGEDQRITVRDEEASKSHGSSIIPPTSSSVVRMQPIQGRVRGRGRGRGRPSRVGEQGGHRSGGRVAGRSTYETFMPFEYSTLAPETSIP